MKLENIKRKRIKKFIGRMSVEKSQKGFIIKNIPVAKKHLKMLSINKKGGMTDITGVKKKFEIIGVLPLIQTKLPKKIVGKLYVLEKLKFKDGRKYFRLGYYIVGKKGRAKGKWTWGQYCPIGPIEDLKKIIKKIKSERFL